MQEYHIKHLETMMKQNTNLRLQVEDIQIMELDIELIMKNQIDMGMYLG